MLNTCIAVDMNLVLQNETLIAIKAPHGTTLKVPDPDEVGSSKNNGALLTKINGVVNWFITSYLCICSLRRCVIIFRGDIELY